MKALQIIQSAYRCTLEEQDDPVVWFTQILKVAGADVDILLKANAVNYVVSGQDASGLSFGKWKQTHPPQLDQDLQAALEKGINVYVIKEDIDERGIPQKKMISGIKQVSRSDIPNLFDSYDQVWHW